jgi:hypothetical protein
MKNKRTGPRVPVFPRLLREPYRCRAGRVDTPQEAFLAVLKVSDSAADEE